jgi:hypothetical protein
MSNNEPIIGTFHDALTGQTIVRELTKDEIAEIPQATDETPTTGA